MKLGVKFLFPHLIKENPNYSANFHIPLTTPPTFDNLYNYFKLPNCHKSFLETNFQLANTNEIL